MVELSDDTRLSLVHLLSQLKLARRTKAYWEYVMFSIHPYYFRHAPGPDSLNLFTLATRPVNVNVGRPDVQTGIAVIPASVMREILNVKAFWRSIVFGPYEESITWKEFVTRWDLGCAGVFNITVPQDKVFSAVSYLLKRPRND